MIRLTFALFLAAVIAASGRAEAATEALHASHPLVLNFIDVFESNPFDGDPEGLDFRLLGGDGQTLRISRRKQIHFLEDGRFALEFGICDRKTESDCANASDFVDVVYTWDMADIAPGEQGMRFLETNWHGRPESVGDTIGVALFCADEKACIAAPGGGRFESIKSAVLPCGGFAHCLPVAALVLNYKDFENTYPTDGEPISEKWGQEETSERTHVVQEGEEHASNDSQSVVESIEDTLFALTFETFGFLEFFHYNNRDDAFFYMALHNIALTSDGRMEIALLVPDADSTDSYVERIRSVGLEDIDPDSLFIQSLRAADYFVLEEDEDPDLEFFALRFSCDSQDNCEGHFYENGQGFFYLPCGDEEACRKVRQTLMRVLPPGSAIVDNGAEDQDVGRLVRQIYETTQNAIFFTADADDNPVSYQTSMVAATPDGRMTLFINYCADGVEDCEPLIRHIDPGKIDKVQQVLSAGADIRASQTIMLTCETDAYCDGHAEQDGAEVYYLPCHGTSACDAVEGLLAKLLGRDPAQTVDQTPTPPAEDYVGILTQATTSALVKLKATEGPALRLIRGAGVSVSNDGKLIVHREVCLALLAIGQPQANECQASALFRSFDLEIDIGNISIADVGVREGDSQAGESGLWVFAECWPGQDCVSLVDHGYPRHEVETIAFSLGEGEGAPQIRVPCNDPELCEEAARALRVLHMLPPGPGQAQSSPETPPNDLAGVWVFESPFGDSVKIEFHDDGTFVHDHPSNKFQGTYVADSGSYAISAPAGSYADNGRYRFIDGQTVEFDGVFGKSVWKREQ